MITHTSTAGRELSHPNETNDCTVIALAHVLGCPYAEAHKICADSGRKSESGMCNYQIQGALNKLIKSGRIVSADLKSFTSRRDTFERTIPVRSRYGYIFHRRPRRTGTTVGQFIHSLPNTGRFYLTSTKHAFAVVDGKLLDNNHRVQTRALMSSCWEIKLPEAKPVITQDQINELWARLDKLEGKV